ncbi:MAG: metalloregulator ArsR/SmtB family transcription factor [Anaerococcus sp.]|uniref:ArsR/SmtB family transcription factor n=1 Tax=Anaerococcus sp. TaxID=1872515 RepID=UPI0026375F96|nr:metalloregulator ArsR/SmtB family transcription factor [Anaerococcus sp.]MCI5972475.1 metalloregulator ArsR/SmtB family transcription factor [Anaerococcus sp.]MDY2928601.1 metalloregulator ArsR/SmtB family transcription factor [Anaerococcus sp.]
MKDTSKKFKLIRKPLLVNEAGLVIYYYTNWLAASNKGQYSFDVAYPGFTFSKDWMLISIEDVFSSEKAYVDFIKKVKTEAFPYLEDFFTGQNSDILNLFYIFTENDENYLPFFAGIFQNLNIFDLEELTYERFKEVYDFCFLKCMGVEISDENHKDLKSLIDSKKKLLKRDFPYLLSKLPYRDELSMELVRSSTNTRSIYDRLVPLLNKLCEIIKKNLPLIEGDLNEHFDHLEEDNFKILRDLSDQVGINPLLNKIESHLNVYSLIIAPNMEMIQYMSEDNDFAFIKFGIFADKEKKNVGKLKLLSQYLKVLGDPTRIDILDLLMEKSYYSKELSDRLFITPATLSYHLSQLHVCGFVGAYIEGRRTYYYLRKPGFKKIIDDLNDFCKNIREENHDSKE